MVPEGWSEIRLGEIMNFKNGLNTDKENYGHGIKFVNVMDIFRSNRLFEENIAGLVNVNEKQLKEYSVAYGDILFNRTSETFDEIAFASVYLGSEPLTFGGFVIRGRLKDKTMIPQYSIYCFQNFDVRKELIRRGQGAVRANIGQKDLAKVPIYLPTVSEQRKISEILSTWDRAIEVTEKLLDKSQQQKSALMQQLLTGKKRLLGFNAKWNSVELGKIAKYSKGYTYKSDDYSESTTEFPFFTLKSIGKGGGFNKKGLKYLTHKVDDKFLVNAGDIIFAITDITRDGDVVGAPVFVPDLGDSAMAISMDLVKLDVKKEINERFLYFALKLRSSRCFMRARASGSTVLHLDVKGSKKLKLLIPGDLNEQKAISSVLWNADREIENLQAKLGYLHQEKQALMQQLLTGKRRVKVDIEQQKVAL